MGIVTMCVDICTYHLRELYVCVGVLLYVCIIHVCEKNIYIHACTCEYMSITRYMYILSVANYIYIICAYV